MRVKSVIIDLRKSRKINREVGRFCVVYNLYFLTVWFVDRDFLSMIKQSHENGRREGQQILKN